MSSKPPKLSLETTVDKKEVVELWLDQFNDWCVLQGWRDVAKELSDRDHWKDDKYAEELSAFRLALHMEVWQMVKSTLVPNMASVKNDTTKETFKGYPWVWQTFLLEDYAGQENVLTERMNFWEVCKQRMDESIADFEARCKFHGRRCEYDKMAKAEDELIRDRFIIGVRDDRLRAELLRHRKDDGSVFTLAEVIRKAKAWETSASLNAHVIEAQKL